VLGSYKGSCFTPLDGRRPCQVHLPPSTVVVNKLPLRPALPPFCPRGRNGGICYWLMLQTYVLPCLMGAVHNGPRLVFAFGTLIMALGPATC